MIVFPQTKVTMSDVSPDKRYKRRDCVGNHPPRITYKATDHVEGTEVMWDEILIDSAPTTIYKALTDAAQALRRIQHENLIPVNYAWVSNSPPRRIVLISEMGTETLRNYVNRVGKHQLLPSIVSKWCAQIIAALAELHAHGIQHRGLTLDNIFIDPGEGTVKVGLPLIESILYGEVLPTAAPEADTTKDLRNDIWLFGLVALEMCTNEEAYGEYPVDERRRKICERVMPVALNNVSDPVIADLIVTCLLPLEEGRPTAEELSEHELFLEGDGLPSQMTEEEARQSPEFLELLRRQSEEKSELLRKQQEARQNLRKEIKERQETKRSLRELLSAP